MTSRAAALRHFRMVDPHFHKATSAYHLSLPLQLKGKRTGKKLFESLVSTIVSQQLGLAAADAIFERVKEACGVLTLESVLKARSQTLRKAGLSGAKIKTLKSIGCAINEKSLNLVSLKNIPEAEASAELQRIWGLGPWSAEMFLMFALGRPDVFSAGDLGLVRAMETIYALPRGAPRERLTAIAEKWAPYRTYASLLLWRTRDSK